MIDERPGLVTVRFTGEGAKQTFRNEAGGHRWQRVPPTEKRGRVHTSTVTVAVLESHDDVPTFLESDVEFRATRGTGPGGQHRNTSDTCIVATHLPTGMQARVDTRSQSQNKQVALDILRARVLASQKRKSAEKRDTIRKEQVGSGMRGDKVRTYRVRDDIIVDNRTGERHNLSTWLRGEWR